MKFCDRIKALRIDGGMTQKDLGRRIGVSEMSVRCWENGTKRPSMSAILALSKVFNVPSDYLLGISIDDTKEDLPLNNQEKALLSNYRLLDKHGRSVVDTLCKLERARVESDLSKTVITKKIIPVSSKSPSRYIPRYTSPSAAGFSVSLGGDDFEMILVDDSVPSDADFAVDIQGESMSPYIHDGDTVYVKKDCDLSVGDIGIFSVDGTMYCKQYYRDDHGNVTLVSANPELKHTNIYMSADSGVDLRCYGKVLLGRRIKLPDYLFE